VLLTPRIWNPAPLMHGPTVAPLAPSVPPPPVAPPGSVSPLARNGGASLRGTDRVLASRPAAIRDPSLRPVHFEQVKAPVSDGGMPRGTRRHLVRTGENFWTISRSYYGTGRYYLALWSANRARVSAPERLVVGTTILIPPVEELEVPPGERPGAPSGRKIVLPDLTPVPETSVPATEPPASRGAPPVRDQTPRPAVPTTAGRAATRDFVRSAVPRRYQVRPGDTLRSIAHAMLGDAGRSGEILAINTKAVPDPWHLTPGAVLLLPPAATQTQRQ
jgi:nucleoid-associated protein YgaU